MKAKLTIKVEIEFDIEPADYPGITDPMEMLKIDVDSVSDDPYLWMWRKDATWTFKGELLNAPNPTPDQRYSIPPA